MLSSKNRRPTPVLLAGLIFGLGAATAHAAPQSAPPSAVATPAATAQTPAAVTNIDFKRSEGGGGKLVISFNGEGAAPDLRWGEAPGTLLVRNAGQSRLSATPEKNLLLRHPLRWPPHRQHQWCPKRRLNPRPFA